MVSRTNINYSSLLYHTIINYAVLYTIPGPYGGGVRWVRTNPPSGTCGKQKSEPNHFVAVQELIEGSELEASLNYKRLEVPSYALYHRTVLHFVMTSLGDFDLAATAAIGLEDIQTFFFKRVDSTGRPDSQ